MTELLAWLVCGVFLLAALAAILPVLLWLAGIAVTGWLIGKSIQSWQDNRSRIDKQIADVIARADKQHNYIMAGREEAGTYGDYLPPPSLR